MDQALFAVVMEAYLHGVSTRKVDDLVKALGADTGISPPLLERGAVEAFEALPLVCGRQGRVRLWTVPVAARAAANGRER